MKTYQLCNQVQQLSTNFEQIEHNEKRTLWVILLTLVTMVVEVAAGHITGSMALLADGYHMASHTGALGIAFFVYKLARSEKIGSRLSFGTGKLLPLGGYTSAIGLGIIAIWMLVESFHRLLNPTSIEFNEAIFVATIGLLVNLISAWILGNGSSHFHEHEHDHDKDHPIAHTEIKDPNHRSALVHVIADALTSVLAIIALIIGKFYQAVWLDPFIGVVGAIVIIRWAYGLCKETAWELLDSHPQSISLYQIKEKIQESGSEVIDLHLWKVGPGNFCCQAIVASPVLKGSAYFRALIQPLLGTSHIVIEERTKV